MNKKQEAERFNYLLGLTINTVKKRKYSLESIHFLDEDNVLAKVVNGRGYYKTIHYRLKNSRLMEMNRWDYTNDYVNILKDLNLVMLGCRGWSHNKEYNFCYKIYDYKKAKFIVEEKTFDNIGYDNTMGGIVYDSSSRGNYLKEYGCFLGYFKLYTNCGPTDYIRYTNPITKEKMYKSFALSETYYALVNTDGTIRGNKLFKGDSFSEITEIIDLKAYSSLQEFKKIRIKELYQIKEYNKQRYHTELELNNRKTPSPYLDEEVAKVITLEK